MMEIAEDGPIGLPLTLRLRFEQRISGRQNWELEDNAFELDACRVKISYNPLACTSSAALCGCLFHPAPETRIEQK